MRAAHHQARRGLVVAVGFTVAAAITSFTPNTTGWWLPLHLFLIGGLLSAMSASTQMLAVTWSASPAPTALVAAMQRWGIVIGTIALVLGRETSRPRLAELGAAIVLVAVAAMVPVLWNIRRRATTPRFRPAIDAYMAAFTIGAAGTGVALALITGHTGSRWLAMRDVHITLNVLGLVGLVIAGTLPYFATTQLRARMPPRATPARIRGVVVALAVSVGAAAAGHWSGTPVLVSAALVAYAAALVAMTSLLPTPTRKRRGWAGPRAAQLGCGVAWWASMTLLLAWAVATDGDDRAVLVALVIGGYAQILVASLAYLGPVLRGGGHQLLTAGFAITRSWPSLAAGNIAAVAALVDARPVLAVAIVGWTMDVTWRALRLAMGTRGHEVAENSIC